MDAYDSRRRAPGGSAPAAGAGADPEPAQTADPRAAERRRFVRGGRASDRSLARSYGVSRIAVRRMLRGTFKVAPAPAGRPARSAKRRADPGHGGRANNGAGEN